MWRALLTLSIVSSPAIAQPAPEPTPEAPPTAPEDAATLFEQGRALAKDGRFAEACDSFARSLALDNTAMGTQVNLADCYEHLGQWARAWRLFADAAAQSEKADNPERACFARERAAVLEAKLVSVFIKLGAANVAGTTVTINGQSVTPAADIAERVDPGDVSVVVSVRGQPPIARSSHTAAGGTVRIDATGEVEPRPSDARSLGRKRGFVLVAVGLGAAGGIELVTSLGLAISARNSYQAAVSSPDCMRANGGLSCDATGSMQVRDAQHLADVATWLGVGGLALAAAATAVYFSAPREVLIAPIAGGGSVGLSAAGRF